MHTAASDKVASRAPGEDLVVLLTRGGELCWKVADEPLVTTGGPPECPPIEAVADDPADHPYRARIEELRRQPYRSPTDLWDILATRDGQIDVLSGILAVLLGLAGQAAAHAQLSPSSLLTRVLLAFPCLCLWHLIAEAFIWIGFAVMQWRTLLRRWPRRRLHRRRLGLALVLAGAVLMIAPLR
jgi:hypothetical protein